MNLQEIENNLIQKHLDNEIKEKIKHEKWIKNRENEAKDYILKNFPYLTYNETEGVYEFGKYKFTSQHTGTSLDGKERGYSLVPSEFHEFGWISSDESFGKYLLKAKEAKKEETTIRHKTGIILSKFLKIMKWID